ncbi:Ubiquinol cytochrome c reductase assembly protein CBP3 [Ceraceosorus bombacis]|uniref:Ubiquinol cytochrome c reductase assembly protein CBP3 n=1 Tax=Ceraceosorus bombacis TaxID=401625 RepID=A0A0P1BB33_9BASI|nr:Ubiquinol cytochrome c reductase assembly protein CBP3 [Ceraceosorus bombacis]
MLGHRSLPVLSGSSSGGMTACKALGKFISAQLTAQSGQQALASASRAICSTQVRSFQTSSAHLSKAMDRESRPEGGKHESGLSPSPRAPRQHSALTKSIVLGLANLFGYNSVKNTAIRVNSDLYDLCAQQSYYDEEFWHQECGLPRTYQVWFQLTNLHVYLLLVRFRAMPPKQAQIYTQELVNHFFIDAESRMRSRFGISTSRLVKGYMRDLHVQHRGAVLGFDEGLAQTDTDAALAAAIWRNIWGQGWGSIGGVKRKVKGIDHTPKGEDASEEGDAVLAKDSGAPLAGPYGQAAAQLAASSAPASGSVAPSNSAESPTISVHADITLEYPIHLAKVTEYVRRETARLAHLSDHEVMIGRAANGRKVPPAKHAPIDHQTSAAVGAGDVVQSLGKRPHDGGFATSVRHSNDDAQRKNSIADFGRVG